MRLNLRRLIPSRKRLVALAVLIVLYLLLMFPAGCGSMLADRLLLFPRTERLPTHGADVRMIDTETGPVQVLIARSPSAREREPERYVLHLMGNATRAEDVAAYVAQRWGEVPTEAWAINYPGYGESPGPATLDKLAPTSVAVFDAMAQEADAAPLYLDGDSIGTAVALHIAAARQEEHRVAGMVLKNPPPMRQLILGRHGWWNLWLLAGPVAAAIPNDLDSIASAGRSRVPAIFLLAERDTLVIPSYQKRVAEAYAGPKHVIDLRGADHNTPLTFEEDAAIRAAIVAHFSNGSDLE